MLYIFCVFTGAGLEKLKVCIVVNFQKPILADHDVRNRSRDCIGLNVQFHYYMSGPTVEIEAQHYLSRLIVAI